MILIEINDTESLHQTLNLDEVAAETLNANSQHYPRVGKTNLLWR